MQGMEDTASSIEPWLAALLEICRELMWEALSAGAT